MTYCLAMEASNQFTPLPSEEQHSNYSIFKRIANLVLVVIATAICINIWLLNTEQSEAWHDKQASQLGRSLSAYGASVVAPFVEQSDTEQISYQLQLLTKDPHVFEVSVFDKSGQVMANNEQNRSVLAHFLIADEPPLVFVEEIVHKGKILGYLRLLLDQQQVMQFHSDYQSQLYQQLLVLMMLAGLAGLLVARAYYKLRYRHYVKRKS